VWSQTRGKKKKKKRGNPSSIRNNAKEEEKKRKGGVMLLQRKGEGSLSTEGTKENELGDRKARKKKTTCRSRKR